MSESAPSRDPATAAAEAVKAYIRMHRAQLAADSEVLSLLLPERFDDAGVIDFSRYVLEKLRDENEALRAERDALKAGQDRGARLSDGVRRSVLDLLGARTFADVLNVATAAAPSFGADRAVFCIEAVDWQALPSCEGVRLIQPGMVAAVVGPDGMGAILSGGGELLFGQIGYRSLAAFRLRIGRQAGLYVLGALAEGRFEGRSSENELGYFARGLERAICACLDLPKS